MASLAPVRAAVTTESRSRASRTDDTTAAIKDLVEEGHAQVVAGADAVQSGFGGGVGLVDGVGAEVGQDALFDVAPQSDRVEAGRATPVRSLRSQLPDVYLPS